MQRTKAAFLVLFLLISGVSITACDTLQDAGETIRDTID